MTSAEAPTPTSTTASASRAFVSLAVSFISGGDSSVLISRYFLPATPHISGTIPPEPPPAPPVLPLLVLVVSVFLLIISTLPLDRSIATAPASASAPETSVGSPPAVGSVGTSFDWSSLGSRYIRSLVALLSDDNIKFNNLSVSYRSNSLLGIVLDDGSLVNEHILLGVIPVDEAVPRLDVEPFHSPTHSGGNNLLRCLLLLLLPSLLLYWLVLRVGHDVMVVWMVTNFSPRLFSKMAMDLVRIWEENRPIINC